MSDELNGIKPILIPKIFQVFSDEFDFYMKSGLFLAKKVLQHVLNL